MDLGYKDVLDILPFTGFAMSVNDAIPHMLSGDYLTGIGVIGLGMVAPLKVLSKTYNVLNRMPLKEAKTLMSKWNKGTYSSRAHSIRDHAKRHEYADDIPKYLRKAANFNKKGARKKILDNGAERWNRSDGEFLMERKGKIITYGINR